MRQYSFAITIILLTASITFAALPEPPKNLADYPMPFEGTFPAISASDLLDKPAGKAGPVVVRDGHFYTGDKRIRFWGVNIAFAACFPTHEQADAVAARLATFGINAVRLHHMDNHPFPSGIWADAACEKISPEAIERLDYFIAALARHGIYSNINLHVSREWSKKHNWPAADQLPDFDKMIDVFNPDLLAANKQYAKDLLTHVNKYTHKRYADDPAVCIVEINNEDSLFLWGGEEKLANLPEPYAGMLKAQWNDWLAKKYPTRDKLKAAWAVGEMPGGEEMLKWTTDAARGRRDYSAIGKEWNVEQHEGAAMTATGIPMPTDAQGIRRDITKVTTTDWHLQFFQAGLKLEKGKFYTAEFSAQADRPGKIVVGVSQAHEPWQSLSPGAPIKLDKTLRKFSIGFTCPADDDNARLTFIVGQGTNSITLSGISLHEGGRLGLRESEDPVRGRTVASHEIGGADTAARSADWFDFLQQTDEKYFVGMRDFLKKEIGVKCPITGTIGLGPLGTASQSKMDFVDAHEYWDHPSFPHAMWDMKDWHEKNKPMVDSPAAATLWELAATRVAGKPFTVTEYNHAAPNEWAAECVPMIASFAALQDWDGVFLFAYSHDANYDKQKIATFFDLEGNPTKMPFLPLAARIFLGRDTAGAIATLPTGNTINLSRAEMLSSGAQYYFQIWPFMRDVKSVEWQSLMKQRLAIQFEDGRAGTRTVALGQGPAKWSAGDPGTGQYSVAGEHGVVFAGFAPASPLKLGPLQIAKLQTPFISLILVPAEPGKTIDQSDRLLLAAVARAENTNMGWNAERTTVGLQWGKPPVKIEVVAGELSLTGKWHVFAVTPAGERGREIPSHQAGDRLIFTLGGEPAVWYEINRVK